MTGRELMQMAEDPEFNDLLENLAGLACNGEQGDVQCKLSVDRSEIYLIPPSAIVAEIIGTEHVVVLVIKEKTDGR